MKKGLGITGTWQNKPKTFEQYIEYRNELILKRDNRRKHFGPATNYYDLRLIEIDAQYPEIKTMIEGTKKLYYVKACGQIFNTKAKNKSEAFEKFQKMEKDMGMTLNSIKFKNIRLKK